MPKLFEWGVGRKPPLGMPRPLAPLEGRRLPVPWSQEADTWGSGDDVRIDSATARSLCLLCGRPVTKGVVVVALWEKDGIEAKTFNELPEIVYQKDLAEFAIDRGPLHERCGKLTVAHCPHFKKTWGEQFQFLPYRRVDKR